MSGDVCTDFILTLEPLVFRFSNIVGNTRDKPVLVQLTASSHSILY